MHYFDTDTGEAIPVEIFITILGASQLIYVEAVKSQKLEDWIWANENAWRYYGKSITWPTGNLIKARCYACHPASG